PDGPVPPQQALSASGPDQIGKGHPLDFVGRSRAFLEIPPEHLVAELIGELEALDEPIADLLVPRLTLATGEGLAKAPHMKAAAQHPQILAMQLDFVKHGGSTPREATHGPGS